MRIRISLLALLFTLSALSAGRPQPEKPAYRFDFEEFNDRGVPVGWALMASAARIGKTVFCAPVPGIEGESAVRLAVTDGDDAMGLSTDPLPVRRGRVTLRYQAVESASGGDNLRVYVICLTPEGKERISDRASFVVPPGEVGDGKWHEATIHFDYLPYGDSIRSILVAPRINEGGQPGPGALLLDDVKVYDTGPPLPKGAHLVLINCEPSQPEAAKGDIVYLSCTLKNRGTAPAGQIKATLEPGFALDPIDRPQIVKKDIAPLATVMFRWKVEVMAGGVLRPRITVAGDGGKFIAEPYLVVGPAASGRTGDRLAVIMEEAKGAPARLSLSYRPGTANERPLGLAQPGGTLVIRLEDGTVYWRSLLLSERFEDPEGWMWRYEAKASATDEGPISMRAELRREIGPERQVLRFEGPRLLWGHGVKEFGGAKGVALLPGLEYLLGDEASSAAKDVIEELADRHVPHPYKITIPMAFVIHDGLACGITWDPMQQWDGEHRCPSVEFSSPNRLHDQANHLMTLFAPSVPGYVDENCEYAERGEPLAEGESMTLVYDIFAQPADDVADVLTWYLANHPPPPPPATRRTLEQENEFCLRAYTERLWVADAPGWRRDYDRPPNPLHTAGVAGVALDASRVCADAQLKSAIRGQILQVLNQGMPQGEDWVQLAFRTGRLTETIDILAQQAAAIVAAQGPEGEFVYRQNQRFPGLGEDRGLAVGIVAGPTYRLLRFASLTGDREALAAGLRGLEFMRKFRRPEGAQTWEVPLHVPDIFASAWAISAYLQGYRATGDRQWLEQARRWALRGLPFVYLWNADDRDIMRYATIAVFGGSHRHYPWFGRPVQWCGLAYAWNLQWLAEYDDSVDWKRIAEGITRCAMQQQSDDAARFGLYPDAWHLWTDRPSTAWFEPRFLLRNVAHLLGAHWHLDHATTAARDTRVYITTGATMTGEPEFAPAGEGTVLRLRLSYSAGDRSFTTVARAVRPDSITVAGDALPDEDWGYDIQRRFIWFRIGHETDAPVEVTVEWRGRP